MLRRPTLSPPPLFNGRPASLAWALVPLLVGCSPRTSTQTPEPQGTATAPTNSTAQVSGAEVSVAGAHLIEGCPGEAADADVAGKRAASRSADMDEIAACGESTLQLVVTADATSSAQVAVEAVYLESGVADESPVPLVAADATRWHDDGGYQAWSGELAAGESAQASYRLTPEPGKPLPSDVQYRDDLTLVITVRVGDATQTLRYAVPSIVHDDMVVT